MKAFFGLDKYVIHRKLLSITFYEDEWTALAISYVKAEVEIHDRLQGLDSILDFLKANSDTPIVLCIRSNSVMSVVADFALTDPGEVLNVFSEAVPNADANEFLIEYTGRLVAFARVNYLQSIMALLDRYESQVVDVGLMPARGGVMALYQNSNSEELNNESLIGDLSYHINSGEVVGFQETDGEQLKVDNLLVEEEHVLSFASCFAFLADGVTHIGFDQIQTNYEEFFYFKLLQKVKMPVLASLLIVFLVNGVFFFQLSANNTELLEKSSTLKVLNQKKESLEKYNLANSEVLSIMSGSPELSIICDQIGYVTPSKIKLTRLVLKPKEEVRGKNDTYLEDKVIIQGFSDSPKVFSQWINKLEGLNWIQEIEDQTYENEAVSSEKGSFQLTIKLNVVKPKS